MMAMKPGTTKQDIADKGIECTAEIYDYLGDKKFICGDTPAIADFLLLETTAYLEKTKPGCIATAYPKFIEHQDRMLALPEMKRYMKTKEYSDCAVQFVPDLPFVQVWINDAPQTNLPQAK